jgi:hypothetical protein
MIDSARPRMTRRRSPALKRRSSGSRPRWRARMEALLRGRGRLNDSYLRSPRRRGRHRVGLGQHAAAHVHAGPSNTATRSNISRRRRGGGRHQVGDHPGQGPQRLRLAQDRGRRASPGSHLAVRLKTRAAIPRLPASTSIR